MSKRMYKQGKRVNFINEVETARSGFIWRNKWYASGWVRSWQYHFLMSQILNGTLYLAELTDYGRQQRIKDVQDLVNMGLDVSGFIH